MYERILTKDEIRLRRTIGRNIRKARQEMSMSLDDVAKASGYAKSKISEMENGTITPNALQIGIFAELFDVSPSFFYTGKEVGIGEEKFFEMRRMLVPVREQMDKYLQLTVTQLCHSAFPAESAAEELLMEVGGFIEQSRNLISKNYQDGWQDMKGGNNFAIRLEQLDYKYRIAKEALSNKRRADKDIKENAQLSLLE